MKKIIFFFMVCLVSPGLLAQDTCATAVPISVGQFVVDAVNGNEVPSPICAPNGTGATKGEWYTYTATQDYSVTISTSLAVNQGKDTRIHVYTGTCGNLACYAGDDDSGDGYLSIVNFYAQQGQTFYIAFDNRWNSSGFTFQVTEQEYVAPPLTFMPTQANFTANYKICVVDMNGDYLDDIVGVSGNQITILYQLPEGGFNTVNIPVVSTAYLPSWSLAAGDWDGNGYNDLVYGGGSGITLMLANNTGTGYTPFTSNTYIFSQRTNFVDINNDGNLDIFVCHDVQPNVYFINDSVNGMVFNQGGIGDFPSGGNYGSIWFDYDNDGDVDLFISKCRGGNTGAHINELHRNNGDGTFTNVAPDIAMNDPIQTWSSAVGDFNNDGFMDILVGASSFANGGHLLKRNNGDGTFTDVTIGSGFDTFTGTSYEYTAHDFDNDGFIDIYGPNGTVFLNNGDMTFTMFNSPSNEGPIGDLNNDGFLDVHNDNTIYYNQPNGNNWLKVTLQGVESNRNGIGARIEIHGDWGIQIRDIMSGTGFEYMSTLNAHFGIGQATAITQLVIKWPSGVIDVINNPTINQTAHIVEGQTLSVENPIAVLEFSMYPNPTDNVLNLVSSTDTFVNAIVYDMSGRVVLNKKLDDAQQVTVATLQSGNYLLQLKSDKGIYTTKRFIKK